MKLITYCKSCSSKTTIDSKKILLRTDLVKQYGSSISYQCKKCLTNSKVHPNQVYAEHSKLPMLFTSLIGIAFIVGGFLVRHNIGYYPIWTFIIGGIVMSVGFFSSSSSNAKSFNKSFV